MFYEYICVCLNADVFIVLCVFRYILHIYIYTSRRAGGGGGLGSVVGGMFYVIFDYIEWVYCICVGFRCR